MENYGDIYKNIADRTQGDIYIGVVGPVRTGKSTFIKRFMDLLVIPNIENDYKRERALDELPQSSGGRTIMTTEPKFIPNEAVEISIGENTSLRVRMIDCVGYIVESALGHIENNSPRMVMTPWNEEPIPFVNAAEIGTKKVIDEHSTIGIVVTTDGTVTDIDREDYLAAEDRVIGELKSLNKPFIVILNTANPNSERARAAKANIEEKHGISVIPVNCKDLGADDITDIMKTILFEFPLSEIGVNIPEWIYKLSPDHWLRAGMMENIKKCAKNITKIREIEDFTRELADFEYVERASAQKTNLGEGSAQIDITAPDNLLFRVIEEASGFALSGCEEIIYLLRDLAAVKKKYEKIAPALDDVARKGYGIVSPGIDELSLEEPEIVRQGSRFGVKLKASAPSIHMIRADIETEVSPIVGTEKQSEDLVHYLLKEFEADPKKIWESNIFGKTLHELVNEGLQNKLCKMPEDAQIKLQETLQKIINDGSGGLICIIL